MSDAVRHLVRLGLNEYEAKAYIATVALGEGTVNEISKESGVPRSRTYDVMERLAEKGLVEMGSSNPRCYRANEPLVASSHLMEEIRHANDEIIKELNELGKKAEKRDNPIWTLTGEWAIEHKVREMMESANSEVAVVSFNNRNLIRYANLISRISESKQVTVVLCHQPEAFAGLLGRCRVLRMGASPNHPNPKEGTVTEKGFITRDGKYCVELMLLCDRDDSLILSREGDGHRAIIINGTILNFFSHDSVEQIIQTSEDVVVNDRPHEEKKHPGR